MSGIALVTICTGRYSIFLDQFLASFRERFVTEHSRTFFVFGDSPSRSESDVRQIYQKKLGWPYDTMMRFEMFNSVSNELSLHEYVFFLNVNMWCGTHVSAEEVLPDGGDGLVGVLHPGYYQTPPDQLPYERRPESRLSIPIGSGGRYFQGCLIGGGARQFLDMSRVLADVISRDLACGIVPVWHDESAMNWYYYTRDVKALLPSFAYPESWDLPFPRRIVQLDKSKFGGHSYLRGDAA